MDSAQLLDRLALRDLVDAYAFAADAADGPALAALFAPDGVLVVEAPPDRGGRRERRGRHEIAGAIAGLARYDVTTHFVGTHRVLVDGDGATGETYCLAHHIVGGSDTIWSVRYRDRFRRTEEGWRFASRHVGVEWVAEQPAVVVRGRA